MKIAVVFLALCAVALAAPADHQSERLLNLPILDEETASLLQELMNNKDAVEYYQNNPELQKAFEQALGVENLFRDAANDDRCLLFSWLLLLSKISVTTSSG